MFYKLNYDDLRTPWFWYIFTLKDQPDWHVG